MEWLGVEKGDIRYKWILKEEKLGGAEVGQRFTLWHGLLSCRYIEGSWGVVYCGVQDSGHIHINISRPMTAGCLLVTS